MTTESVQGRVAQRYFDELGVPIPMECVLSEDAMIGYLTEHPSGNGAGFLCLECGAGGGCSSVPMFGRDLGIYKATCVRCHQVIVQGCGVELMDGE